MEQTKLKIFKVSLAGAILLLALTFLSLGIESLLTPQVVPIRVKAGALRHERLYTGDFLAVEGKTISFCWVMPEADLPLLEGAALEVDYFYRDDGGSVQRAWAECAQWEVQGGQEETERIVTARLKTDFPAEKQLPLKIELTKISGRYDSLVPLSSLCFDPETNRYSVMRLAAGKGWGKGAWKTEAVPVTVLDMDASSAAITLDTNEKSLLIASAPSRELFEGEKVRVVGYENT